jgi:single-strand DNA-binding protein
MVNKVIILGSVGKDPESRTVGSGSMVVTLNVATSRKWREKTGDMKEETEWHRVVVWGKSAEYAVKYLAKGSKVYVEGRLQTTKWQDKNGNDRFTTEVVAETIQGFGGKSDSKPQQSNNEDPLPF